MDDLLAARWQMGLSLGFHIIFASIGIAMPFLMAASHWLYLRRKDELYRVLTKAWSKGVAIFFAVGAVSGTALSFELGMLWPGFMEHAGAIIGMPFSWEGTAFFIEAIALGLFLYGWERMHPIAHWLSGLVVGVAGVASAFFVICANAWMNSPSGFDWNNGHPINIDPWEAMFNDAAFIQGLHMVVVAFVAVGFAVAGMHALLWLRTRHKIHQKALKISLLMGSLAALAQPIVGDFAAKSVAQRQPIKLAAMEALYETQRRAPLVIGGITDNETGRLSYALEIPGLLSFLAFGSFDAEVKGLNDFPKDEWPPIFLVHVAFQTMVFLGMLLALTGILGLIAVFFRQQWLKSQKFLWHLVFCIPLGFIAIEAGWMVTELGRQPWIIYGLMKTSEALSPRPGIFYSFIAYTGLYFFLCLIVSVLLYRQTLLLHNELGIRRAKSS